MWKEVAAFFIPDKGIEDVGENIALLKVLGGIIAGLCLFALAFAVLTGTAVQMIEVVAGIAVSNATIYVLLGAFLIWFTLTRIGVKNKDSNE